MVWCRQNKTKKNTTPSICGRASPRHRARDTPRIRAGVLMIAPIWFCPPCTKAHTITSILLYRIPNALEKNSNFTILFWPYFMNAYAQRDWSFLIFFVFLGRWSTMLGLQMAGCSLFWGGVDHHLPMLVFVQGTYDVPLHKVQRRGPTARCVSVLPSLPDCVVLGKTFGRFLPSFFTPHLGLKN